MDEWKEKLQRARKRRGRGTANRGMAGETRIGMDGRSEADATGNDFQETDVKGAAARHRRRNLPRWLDTSVNRRAGLKAIGRRES